ncbi:MAG: ribose-phosphate pyrophosphokinase [Candidatus Levybacteria bacterium]|nr:ribose-phosphate pyrophosphokinase [Candidatus Levybacteria bacterium]
MKIFSGSSNKPLAEKIAKELKISLSPLEIDIFPDGEKRVRVVDKVINEDTVVIQTTSPNPNDCYMELFFIVDALKRSGAKTVTAVVPYLGYQRQDHIFRDGEAVSLEVIVETLESVGMNRLITLDLHSVKIPELFSIPIVHLSALPIFAEKIKEILRSAEVARENFPVRNARKVSSEIPKSDSVNARNENFESSPRINDTILVSPDMGGIRRIKLLSEMLDNMSYVSIIKDRDLATGNIESNRVDVSGQEWKKGVKTAIIVDDMISTGRTIAAAADLLRKNSIEKILVFVTHPVLSNDAKNILESSKVSKIYVTDSINVPREKGFDKLEILSVSGKIAKELGKN